MPGGWGLAVDRLRAFRDRSRGRESHISAGVPLKSGGHGDHWGCVFRSVEEADLLGSIRQTVENARPESGFAGGRGSVYRSGSERLTICVLVVERELVSAYPEALGGPVWPVTVQEVVPWANGLEGQITGDCNGASISFFDTRFYEHGSSYLVGRTYEFSMGALAYKLGPAEEIEVESEIGAKVSLKGACAYMPAGTGNDEADIDDYWFHSPLGGKVTQSKLAGQELALYPVTMGIPLHFEMNVDLCAAGHVIAPELAMRKPGDDLEGFLWLQGKLRP